MKDSGAGGSVRTITFRRIVDLAHTIHPHIPLWPGDPPVSVETVAELSRDGYRLRQFCIGEHSATHINAPSSFFETGASVDAIPAQSLVAPAVVIDVRDRASEPDFALSRHDVELWEAQHQPIPGGAIVLLCTGWDRRWDDPAAFLNQDERGRPRLPAFTAEAVRFMLDDRQIGGVGTDTHGVDDDDTFSVNKLVLARNGIVLENLAHLEQLPPVGATLDLTGWTWFTDAEEREPIEPGRNYRYTYKCVSGIGACSIYPWSALTGAEAGLSLALPLSQGPRVFVTQHNQSAPETSVTFFFGLVKDAGNHPSRAPFSFVL